MSKINKKLFFLYVKDYIERLRSELKSEQTIISYRASLNDFRKYLSHEHLKKVDKVTFECITPELIREYLSWISAEGRSLNTRNLRLTALKCYVSFCAEKYIELVSLELKLSKIKTKSVAPKTNNWLSKEQITLILDQPSQSKLGIRDRFIMMFMFSTGVRLSELLNIQTKDLFLKADFPSVIVLGKGQKTRRIPLPDDLIENLKYYLTLYHSNSNLNKEGNYLFFTKIKGKTDKMSADNIQRITKKYGDMARKIDSKIPVVHPHLFRHSYGAQMYRLGLSLPEISKLLGHLHLQTSEIYCETDVDMISKAIEDIVESSPERKWDILSEEDKLKVLGLI